MHAACLTVAPLEQLTAQLSRPTQGSGCCCASPLSLSPSVSDLPWSRASRLSRDPSSLALAIVLFLPLLPLRCPFPLPLVLEVALMGVITTNDKLLPTWLRSLLRNDLSRAIGQLSYYKVWRKGVLAVFERDGHWGPLRDTSPSHVQDELRAIHGRIEADAARVQAAAKGDGSPAQYYAFLVRELVRSRSLRGAPATRRWLTNLFAVWRRPLQSHHWRRRGPLRRGVG